MAAMGRILITGATGFVGRALVAALASRHHLILPVRRTDALASAPQVEVHPIGEIGPETDWSSALDRIETVIHLAAHVHVAGPEEAAGFDRVNRAGTRRLAEAARAAGVARFIYLSSAKVHGEESFGQPFREDDAPRPEGPYATSKWQAEQALAEIAAAGGPAMVILRPPLVYGPGAKANVASLLRLCRLGLPLPFGAIDNRRSLIFLGNLVAAIERVVDAPLVSGCRTYLLRDGEDLSTGDLVRRLGAAAGRRVLLLPVPPGALAAALRLIGRGGVATRLLGSFAVDDSRFRADFAWTSPFTVDHGLALTAAVTAPAGHSWLEIAR
jgi:nucleoside-diphosphate-sugar epimerase